MSVLHPVVSCKCVFCSILDHESGCTSKVSKKSKQRSSNGARNETPLSTQ